MPTTHFVSFHVVNSLGIHQATRPSLDAARDYVKCRKDHCTSPAPFTIHRVVSRPVERHYTASGTVYKPLDARTLNERRLARKLS